MPARGTQIAKTRVGGRGTWYCPPLPAAAARRAARLAGWPTRPSTRSRRSTTRTIRRRGSRCSTACATQAAYEAYKRRVAELLEPVEGKRVYVEVGCGTGADAGVGLASRFRVSVAGVDVSRTMVDEARRRGLRAAHVASAEALPFADSSFDGCWADRVFQHLSDPDAALAEMVQVTRPGGRIVAADPDYDTQVVDVPDRQLARPVLRFRADTALRHGTLAHRMGGLFAEAGLTDVVVEAAPVVPARPDCSRQCDGPPDVGRGRPRARRAASGGRGGVGAGDRRRCRGPALPLLVQRLPHGRDGAVAQRGEARRRAPSPGPDVARTYKTEAVVLRSFRLRGGRPGHPSVHARPGTGRGGREGRPQDSRGSGRHSSRSRTSSGSSSTGLGVSCTRSRARRSSTRTARRGRIRTGCRSGSSARSVLRLFVEEERNDRAFEALARFLAAVDAIPGGSRGRAALDPRARLPAEAAVALRVRAAPRAASSAARTPNRRPPPAGGRSCVRRLRAHRDGAALAPGLPRDPRLLRSPLASA